MTRRRRPGSSAAGTAWAFVSAVAVCAAGAGPPEVEPYEPGSVVEGKALGEWSVEWWRWALSYPRDSNPLLDGTGKGCAAGQSGPVFFLGALEDPSRQVVISVRDECRVPEETHLFFPIFASIVLGTGGGGEDCGECEEVDGHLEPVKLYCMVDGTWLADLEQHRESSSGCFDITLPEDNLEARAAGDYSACAGGYWIMLPPLPPGTHIIRYQALRGDPENPLQEFSITYFLQVGGPPPPAGFRRADVSGDAGIDLSDPIGILEWLFIDGRPPPCPDAADAQDDGAIDLSDPIFIINFLYLSGPAPASPGPIRCGDDPSEDDLGECSPSC